MEMMRSTNMKQISEWFIKPKYKVEEAKQPYYLSPMDLTLLSIHYIQKGLLLKKPSNILDNDHQHYSIDKLVESLKESLSLALVHFYSLAGQFATQVDGGKSLIYVDCNKGPGARFIHGSVDISISDILSPIYVPEVVHSFFDHYKCVNHDGHSLSLLTVKVTELLDGVFIGCSMNHALADGTSFWHFWNMWSEIHQRSNQDYDEGLLLLLQPLSRMPVHNRWFPQGYGPAILLPFAKPDEFISRYEAPKLQERIFHFSSKSMARLKAKANDEQNSSHKISSFQALSALCWRAIVQADCVPYHQLTSCKLAVNNRKRLTPSLSEDYFGNCISAIKITITAGELAEHRLGWVASLLHQSVVNHDDKSVRDFYNGWMKSPIVFQPDRVFDSYSVLMSSSPRFDMYGNEFGLGKAVGVRNGYANKFAGKVTSYPGYHGGGSVDLEICLSLNSMTALESNEEFMEFVSIPCKP